MNRIEHLAEGVTLYLGDCREILPGLSGLGAFISDPPYGVNARAGMGGGDKGAGGMWAGATIVGGVAKGALLGRLIEIIADENLFEALLDGEFKPKRRQAG